MKSKNRNVCAACAALLFVTAFTIAVAAQDAANVAGTWTISVSRAAGNAEQMIILEQDGSKITGTFKGARQSGPLAGSVTGKVITFHVSMRVRLDYKGTMEGDSMKGTMTRPGASFSENDELPGCVGRSGTFRAHKRSPCPS